MFRDSYVLCIYVMNIICTFPISVSWVWYISAVLLHLVYFCFDIVVMALFGDSIRRDSASLSGFTFHNHVQFFSCEVSLTCHLKYPYSCFSSHFCFLVIFILLMLMLSVLFLVPVSFFLRTFLMLSSSRIDASTLSSMPTSPLPPLFSGNFQSVYVILGVWSLMHHH